MAAPCVKRSIACIWPYLAGGPPDLRPASSAQLSPHARSVTSVHPAPTARRRRHSGAAVVLSIGALLVTARSAAAIQFPTPDDSAVSPPPPSQPTRANGDTKHTTRLYGKNAFQEAVAVTQLVYPADGPTGEDDSFPDDRPRAVTLLTPDDPLTAITATPLIHFPDNAPVLYVTRNGIPKITSDELKRLKPVGMGRHDDIQA